MPVSKTVLTPEQLASLREKQLKANPQKLAPAEDILAKGAEKSKEFKDINGVVVPKEWQQDYKREAPKPKEKYKRIEFDDPVAFSCYYDPQLAAGQVSFYDWQAFSLYLMADPSFSIAYPLEFNLVASNGSGKDAYVIAKIAVFLLVCRIRGRVVITTKDFNQLSMQTYAYIAAFAEAVNKKMLEDGYTDKKEFIRVRQGHITCEDTGGEIVLFVTDESKRAEGYHPWNDHPDSELTIIVNEAKSVLDTIFGALRRCTGYKRFICVSSTGTRSGYFYREVQRSIKFPAPVQLGKPYARFVTSYECKHVPPAVIQRDKETLEPWLFESIHESKFSSVDGNYVCPEEFLLPAFYICKTTLHQDKDKYFLALDASLGGDETVLLFANGNMLVDGFDWRIKDNTLLEPILAKEINKLVHKYHLDRKNTTFNADAGGSATPILNHLRRMIPLNINYIYNNGKVVNKRIYGTPAAEDYFHLKQLFLKHHIRHWEKWPKIIYQYALRQFENRGNKIYLEPKVEVKSRGEDSPDWADTLVLLWRRYKFGEIHQVKAAKDAPIPQRLQSPAELQIDWDRFATKKLREVEFQNRPKGPKTICNALNSYYGRNRYNKYFGR